MSGLAGMQTIRSDCAIEAQQSGPPIGDEEIEGLDPDGASWGDYSINASQKIIKR